MVLLGDARVHAVLFFVVGAVIVRWGARFAAAHLSRLDRPQAALLATKAITYGGIALLALAALDQAGVDVSTVLATAGVAGVAVGFAAQTSLSNVIAGLFLLVDKPFQVGDTVELDGVLGVVAEIRMMSTFVRTFDNQMVRWPNEVVLKAKVVNHSRNPARRLNVPFSVAYGSDLARAREVVKEAVVAMPWVLLEPETQVYTNRFLDSGVELEVRAWIRRTHLLDARTAIVEAIHDALEDADITIPFPQVVVWKGTEDTTP